MSFVQINILLTAQTTKAVEKCCSELTECECDVSACPLYKAPTCDAQAGFKSVTTASVWCPYNLPSCCPVVHEEVCVCDRLVINVAYHATNTLNVYTIFSSLCPVAEEPICQSHESISMVPTSSCCIVPKCICDVNKCERGSSNCASNKHVEITRRDCCEFAECVCNECCPPNPCKVGWIATQTIDDCGCVISKLFFNQLDLEK